MTAGGARPGAGRKKKDNPKKVESFRVDPELFNQAVVNHGRKEVTKKVNDLIKRMAKTKKK